MTDDAVWLAMVEQVARDTYTEWADDATRRYHRVMDPPWRSLDEDEREEWLYEARRHVVDAMLAGQLPEPMH